MYSPKYFSFASIAMNLCQINIEDLGLTPCAKSVVLFPFAKTCISSSAVDEGGEERLATMHLNGTLTRERRHAGSK